jgi:NAD(P)-dependent dehydrogenase (short-subunit alcohol dehydrogenase family)
MKEFNGRVAVITGGASGLGRAMAFRFAREGMKVVIADMDEKAMAQTEAELREGGARAVSVKTDVSKAAQVEALAEKALAAFGAIHIVANNAGVAEGGAVWENTIDDWEWVLGVNVWGVIHGLRVFTPIMLTQDTEGHIVNTASVAGLLSPPGMGIYCVSKHSVVTLTECLHQDLAERNAKIKCSVLCPAYVPTGISESGRNRPAELKEQRKKSARDLALEESLRHAVAHGKVSPEQVADAVFEAVRDEKFYILTHKRIKDSVRMRLEDIIEERNPRNPMG